MTFGTPGRNIVVVSVQGACVVFWCFDYTLAARVHCRSDAKQDHGCAWVPRYLNPRPVFAKLAALCLYRPFFRGAALLAPRFRLKKYAQHSPLPEPTDRTTR